jgi:hypothetical protein
MLRRTLASEQLALMGLQDALENFSTLGGLGVGDTYPRNFESLF